MRIKKDTWVFVADGGKSLVLENVGTPLHPEYRVVNSSQQDNPPTHVQGRDRPVRTGEKGQARRSTFEAPDLHEREEERFLRTQIDELTAHHAAGRFARLLIIAPPVALGRIRAALNPDMENAVLATLAKDIVNQPIDQIAASIDEVPIT